MLVAGCTDIPHYSVNIDSIRADNANEKRQFILFPANKDTSIDDLQFKEYAAYIKRALTLKGFVPAESNDTANLGIFVSYGVGNPQQNQYSYSLPEWGQTGISSSTTYGTLNMNRSYGTYKGTTSYTPTYGVTGFTSYVDTYTTYPRFLVLDAIDLIQYRKSQTKVQLWKTTVTSEGSSNDLRKVLPFMITASKPYIATNSGQQIKVDIEQDDPSVLEIKGQSISSVKE